MTWEEIKDIKMFPDFSKNLEQLFTRFRKKARPSNIEFGKIPKERRDHYMSSKRW